MNILVADDDSTIRRLVSATLRSDGHDVLEAATGDDAVEAAHDELELLITDLVMPPFGGLELAEQLRRRIPQLSVLYMSGYAPRTDFNSDPRASQLSKPFTLTQLREHVQWLLVDRS